MAISDVTDESSVNMFVLEGTHTHILCLDVSHRWNNGDVETRGI